MSLFSALTPGRVFAGDYVILSRLREGGMGAVFTAEQRSTQKKRALKLMLPNLVGDAKLRERFVREAQIGSQIDSEHVVEVVGAGIDADTGMPWLAMELLDGEELGVYADRKGCLPAAEVVTLMTQLCHALAAAHAVGIVHRDLKPENLFLAKVRRAGSSSILKILDFGIAKLTADAKTKATDTIGSPLWMAPEQSQRGSGITPAADIWALGLIVFRLLTGKVFWLSAEDENASQMTLLREIVFEPMPLASERRTALRAPGALPAGFDAWFARACAKEPKERFNDVSEALRELAACLAPVVHAAPAPSATVSAEPIAPIALARADELSLLPSSGETRPFSAQSQPVPAPVARTELGAPSSARAYGTQDPLVSSAPVQPPPKSKALIYGGIGAAAAVAVIAVIALSGGTKDKDAPTSVAGTVATASARVQTSQRPSAPSEPVASLAATTVSSSSPSLADSAPFKESASVEASAAPRPTPTPTVVRTPSRTVAQPTVPTPRPADTPVRTPPLTTTTSPPAGPQPTGHW